MLELVVWNVQHGSAVYAKMPNGQHIAIDLGASGENGSVFSPLQTLRFTRGLQRLDGLIITHPHRDHLDDIFSLQYLPATILHTTWHLTDHEILAGNQAEDSAIINSYLNLRNGCSFPAPVEKQVVRGEDFLTAGFQIFCPTKASRKNLNDHSLVVVISYAGLKVVIPGDNEPTSWRELLEDPAFRVAVLDADILVASHHGRESGYCSELFDTLGEPRLVVVSDGEFCDTSATTRYSARARGWRVFDPFGDSETRYCVTTRNDGHITIKCGWNVEKSSAKNFLNVTTSKRMERSIFSSLAAPVYGAGPLRR